MGFLSIPRPSGIATREAGGQTPSEATFLSTESLTFPGMTGFGSVVIGLISHFDAQPPDLVVVLVGVVLGAALMALGFLDPDRIETTPYARAVQAVIGVANTVLLIAALLGVATVTG